MILNNFLCKILKIINLSFKNILLKIYILKNLKKSHNKYTTIVLAKKIFKKYYLIINMKYKIILKISNKINQRCQKVFLLKVLNLNKILLQKKKIKITKKAWLVKINKNHKI